MSNLQNKVFLVTGAGSGVGRATAQLLAKAGAKVAIAGRDAKKLVETAKGWPEMLILPTDVTDSQAVERMVAAATTKFGRIDVLVNNAGTNVKHRKTRELSMDDWNKLIRTNLDGPFYCIKAVLPQWLERKEGLVININSVSGKRAYPLAGPGYAASKFGMHALAGCLAGEELESGIRVSSIYPGEIDTPILDERPTPVSAEQRAKILKPEDVAQAVLFIAGLPVHVNVPELIIKPTAQGYF